MPKLPFETESKVLTRKESSTDANLGCNPGERPTEEIINYGVVNIDKPRCPTSHEVSAFVQNILKIKKSGHSGTLDPAVTGVLPVALGRATKVVQALLCAGKEYVALMHLHKEVEEDNIKKRMMSFVGKLQQLPPIKSAVKRQERTREVYYIDIMEIDGKDVLFKIGCQAGTYVRKYIHDFGQKLGVGAHMAELRRTRAGPFDESTLVTLQDLTDAFHYYKEENNDKFLRKVIQPVENAVSHLPKVWVFDTTVSSLCHGIDLKVPGISKVHSNIQIGNFVAVMTLKEELIALGEANMISKELLGDKGIAVRINKVFMESKAYESLG